MKQIIAVFIFAVVAFGIFSCDSDDQEKQRKVELQILADYTESNHPGVEPKSSGLYFISTEEGSGDTIKVGDRVQIFYATWTLDSATDSTLIDESNGYSAGQRYEPLEFYVGSSSTITGLEEAVTYMYPGGKAKLVIPSELAYGTSYSNGVPGFTTLLMEVEIYKVYPAN